MKYIIELDSPDMRVMVDLLDAGLISLAIQHASLRLSRGRGHHVTVAAGQRVDAAKRAVNALAKAVREAQPEHSTGTNEGAPMSDPDDARQATSRPMRVKASNLRRRSQL